ncbi:hypothetical protein BGY98DRAFT_969981, partial [Russula aff. rugulosa BPL654]
MAKELIAGFAGAFIDKQFETHGLDLSTRRRRNARPSSMLNKLLHNMAGTMARPSI